MDSSRAPRTPNLSRRKRLDFERTERGLKRETYAIPYRALLKAKNAISIIMPIRMNADLLQAREWSFESHYVQNVSLGNLNFVHKDGTSDGSPQ